MNAQLRSSLLTEPRPSDADDVCVTRERDGWWRIAWWRAGLTPEPFGPPFASATEACAASLDVRTAHGLT